MDRLQRFEALTSIPEPAAVGLAERILDGSLGDVAVITPPTVGMVMARAQDGAKGEVFNLGEVLVTEARVSIAGREGWGMVLGLVGACGIGFKIQIAMRLFQYRDLTTYVILLILMVTVIDRVSAYLRARIT